MTCTLRSSAQPLSLSYAVFFEKTVEGEGTGCREFLPSPPSCTLGLLGRENHDLVMRGTNPLSPNRNDIPISGRVSGLGPSVEDALWRGSATVPPVLNVNLSRINLNLR
ncbi:hypothetical protein BDQ94DRAFT_69985 [Aspergillus welwitschiae]|uniref:Uncharacterized protein n=1 Tax=Aspergillus welwitschiae TaxID=1341132 RepID=A0A3F3QFT8_9EURO|nr:hypothetical protein BDQ94DRAFT_69985 [Aspergillus welwitschiae]RDH37792.1 hypothetical protein BDQ94DRAFT_69985 [Aspergillus welwitschiae]